MRISLWYTFIVVPFITQNTLSAIETTGANTDAPLSNSVYAFIAAPFFVYRFVFVFVAGKVTRTLLSSYLAKYGVVLMFVFATRSSVILLPEPFTV